MGEIELRFNGANKGKTAEEILKEMKRKRIERTSKLTEEEREAKREKMRGYKERNHGKCEICGKEYNNIYQHRNTKRHKEKMKK